MAKAAGFQITPVDDAWRAARPRDAALATQAYLDRLPAQVLAKSAAYYTGGYWLKLWSLLLSVALAVWLITGRRAARLRDWAQRVGRGPLRRDALFGVAFSAIASLVGLPLAFCQGCVREHQHGMSTQTVGAWLGEFAIGQAIEFALMAAVVAGLYALIRRAAERWWIWGTAASLVLMSVLIALSPVFIEPLFNTYKPVEDGPLKRAVLPMAHANGVPVDNIYEFDASRQTTRISANVSGLFGTAAVFSVFFTLATPVLNTITRVQEIEADHFGLNLAREPHGFAEAQLRLVGYRKANPGPVEEFIFFTHPSVRNRIFDAMRWREAMGTP